jgi:hypothetical protein
MSFATQIIHRPTNMNITQGEQLCFQPGMMSVKRNALSMI